jgi:hypothetical protein
VETERTRPNWRTRFTARMRTAVRGLRPATIQCDETGLTVTAFHHDGSISITGLKWQEVNGVVYKRDLYTIELVGVGLTTAQGTIEVNEQMEGWVTVVAALPLYLPGTPNRADWSNKVVQPAFVANPTTLLSSR